MDIDTLHKALNSDLIGKEKTMTVLRNSRKINIEVIPWGELKYFLLLHIVDKQFDQVVAFLHS